MSIWYEIEGSVRVRVCHEVEEIVTLFNEEESTSEMCATYSTDDENSQEALVEFEGGCFMSTIGAEKLADIVRRLSPYAIEPALLRVDDDGEDGFLYVGPPELKARTISRHTLAGIRAVLEDLTEEDKKKLVEELNQQLKPSADPPPAASGSCD